MDEMVIKALAKWPNVPACYDWLGLDARGNWYMRDEPAQARGPFQAQDTAQARGSVLRHDKLIEFICRNYEPDALGQWFFQNGPQRVFVELELTPLVCRVNADFSVQDHTGQPAWVLACLLDENGRLYLQCERGVGLVHTLDMGYAADAIEQGIWSVEDVLQAAMPARFGYVKSPRALQKT